MRMRRSIALGCLAAVLAAGCGSGSAAGDGTPTSNAPDPTDEEAVDLDATLRIAVLKQNTQLDPVLAKTSIEEQQLDMIYDKLTRMTPDGDVEGELAERWEFTDDGLLLELRDGVQFHDGTALDAEAVKVNLDRARTLEESTVRADLAIVTDVQVVDAATVLLKMEQRDVTILPVLSTRAGAIASPAAIEAGTLSQEPVGAGPFELASWTQDVGQVLERWDGYWNPDVARVAKIEVTVLPDAAARLNAVRSGAIDMAEISANQIPEAEGAGLHVETTVLQTVTSLQISSVNVPAFADERVRMAVNYAIDREGIVQGLLQGNGQPTAQYFPEGTIAHDASLEDPYPYDPEKAKELLAEAGFPDGFEFTLNYGSWPSGEELEAIAGSLSEVGITMRMEQLQGNESILRMWTNKTGQAIAFPGNTQPDPSLAFGTFLPGHLRNPANLASERVTELWEQSLRLEDFDERSKVLQEASRELTKHPLSVVPLYSNTGAWAMSDEVVGFKLPPSNLWTFRGVGVTK